VNEAPASRFKLCGHADLLKMKQAALVVTITTKNLPTTITFRQLIIQKDFENNLTTGANLSCLMKNKFKFRQN
jgi:hypothetical protein